MNYSIEQVNQLKANIREKKNWISNFALSSNMPNAERSLIDAELAKHADGAQPTHDILDVFITLDLYKTCLKNLIWNLCDQHGLQYPACSYFTLKGK